VQYYYSINAQCPRNDTTFNHFFGHPYIPASVLILKKLNLQHVACSKAVSTTVQSDEVAWSNVIHKTLRPWSPFRNE
jgi:hypothetical protein